VVTSHKADSLARMLAAVLMALVVGTLVAFGGSFSGRVVEREAIAAASIPAGSAIAPGAKHARAKDEPYMPMTRSTASLLLFSVLRSGGGR